MNIYDIATILLIIIIGFFFFKIKFINLQWKLDKYDTLYKVIYNKIKKQGYDVYKVDLVDKNSKYSRHKNETAIINFGFKKEDSYYRNVIVIDKNQNKHLFLIKVIHNYFFGSYLEILERTRL